MFPIFMRGSAQYEGLEGAVSQSPITRAESLKMVIYPPLYGNFESENCGNITLRYFKYPLVNVYITMENHHAING